jgi:hypothetical protein
MVIAALVTFGILVAAWIAAPDRTRKVQPTTEMPAAEAPAPA